VRVRRSGSSFSGEFVLSKTAMAMAGDVEVMVPLEGLVDPKVEMSKLQKDKLKADSDIAYLKRKLADPNYLSRAPAEVVDKDKAKLAELEAALAKLVVAIDRLK
jgi:valyl-tRNA synthetase